MYYFWGWCADAASHDVKRSRMSSRTTLFLKTRRNRVGARGPVTLTWTRPLSFLFCPPTQEERTNAAPVTAVRWGGLIMLLCEHVQKSPHVDPSTQEHSTVCLWRDNTALIKEGSRTRKYLINSRVTQPVKTGHRPLYHALDTHRPTHGGRISLRHGL